MNRNKDSMVNISPDKCHFEDSLPEYVTLGYGIIYSILFIICLIWSFVISRKDTKWSQKSCWGKFILFISDLNVKKKLLIPLIAHLMDQATDIGTIIEFINLYKRQQKYGRHKYCANVYGLFFVVVSIFAFMLYRIISTIQIWKMTNHSMSDTMLQLMDLEIFKTIFIAYKLESKDVT